MHFKCVNYMAHKLYLVKAGTKKEKEINVLRWLLQILKALWQITKKNKQKKKDEDRELFVMVK